MLKLFVRLGEGSFAVIGACLLSGILTRVTLAQTGIEPWCEVNKAVVAGKAGDVKAVPLQQLFFVAPGFQALAKAKLIDASMARLTHQTRQCLQAWAIFQRVASIICFVRQQSLMNFLR